LHCCEGRRQDKRSKRRGRKIRGVRQEVAGNDQIFGVMGESRRIGLERDRK
jgi:hypothetical protein